MQNDLASTAGRFSAASGTYHQAAVVQQQVAGKVFQILAPLLPVKQMLEVGCGTGVLTEMVCRAFPGVQIDAVDVSSKMIAQAKQRLADATNVRWIVSDANELALGMNYSLIVSSSSLHWIHPLEDSIARLSGLLEPGGALIFALMVQGTLKELHACRRLAAPGKPIRRSLPTQQEVHAALETAALKIMDEQQETVRLHYPSAAVILRQLHQQGVTGGHLSSSGLALTRSELEQLIRDYDRNYSDKRGVVATYRVCYFSAMKPRPKKTG